jgi:hypothetical protein
MILRYIISYTQIPMQLKLRALEELEPIVREFQQSWVILCDKLKSQPFCNMLFDTFPFENDQLVQFPFDLKDEIFETRRFIEQEKK